MGNPIAQDRKEAAHILNAMNKVLWMPSKGWYAEYKDALGLKMLHPSAALWTIYHATDSKVANPFQAYECLQYIDHDIPHIPVRAMGLPDENSYVLSTTNWQPYTWSLNNVVLAENLHTALAYWRGNRPEGAFNLWRSALVESMFLGASPGNFEQLSFYDAARGELYRDFADPIGVAARSLVEGLFGIQPDALHSTLVIQPGFPADWDHAFLSTPDISFSCQRTGDGDAYTIISSFTKKLKLQFMVRARKDAVQSVTVNGKMVKWTQKENSIGYPYLQIIVPYQRKYSIVINWKGDSFERPALKPSLRKDETLALKFSRSKVVKIFDPEHSLSTITTNDNRVTGLVNAQGNKTFFVEVRQGDFKYWQPFSFAAEPNQQIENKAPGIHSNTVFNTINLQPYYNAKITDIFTQQYLSPRVKSPTLQLPSQGIGNWCYPLTQANIDDEGLRKLAGNKDEITAPQGVPFSTPSDSSLNNILFTSQWDNYPKQAEVPLNGSASHIYLLMAGSTNPMQSRVTNGEVIVQYTNGDADTLQLRNPENWWPIEQDYMMDGYAFTTGAPFPLRLYLKDGKFGYGPLDNYSTIKGFTNMAIDGGAATVLDMPLNKSKTLKSLTLKTLANDVVIGLISVTLQRN